MKTLITYILISLGIFSLFTTCKKYPEDGFTKRGPKLILGNWKLTLYEVNGIDSTDLINYNGDDTYKKCTFLKHHNRDSEIIIQTEGNGTDKAGFKNKNSSIVFNSISQTSLNCVGIYCNKDYFTPEGFYTQEWQINKLTKNELKLSCNIKNSYVVKFSKI